MSGCLVSMIKNISGSSDIRMDLKKTYVSNHIYHGAFKDTAPA